MDFKGTENYYHRIRKLHKPADETMVRSALPLIVLTGLEYLFDLTFSLPRWQEKRKYPAGFLVVWDTKICEN